MEVITKKEATLLATDRCDARDCGAQAYVKAIGVSGELTFCGHHYEGIVDNAIGWANLEKFAYQVIDERDRLIENRLMVES